MRASVQGKKELHEGDCFSYKGYDFQLCWWDPVAPGDMEYGISCIEFSETYAPDLDLIIGFVPPGSTENDVMKVIRENFWKVQNRIDINATYPTLGPKTFPNKVFHCQACDRRVSSEEILLKGKMNQWVCPYCGTDGPFIIDGSFESGSRDVKSKSSIYGTPVDEHSTYKGCVIYKGEDGRWFAKYSEDGGTRIIENGSLADLKIDINYRVEMAKRKIADLATGDAAKKTPAKKPMVKKKTAPKKRVK